MGIKGTAILGAGVIAAGLFVLNKAQAEGSGAKSTIRVSDFNVFKGDVRELSDGTMIIDISVGGLLKLSNLQNLSQPGVFLRIVENGTLGKFPLLQRGEISGIDGNDNVELVFTKGSLNPTTPSTVDFIFTLEDSGEVIDSVKKSVKV